MNKFNESVNLEKTLKIEITHGENEHPERHEENVAQPIGEFKITVRKLEMPVRPRGVLAE
jgi:hypothetical protein